MLEDAGIKTVYKTTYAIDTKNFDSIVAAMKSANPDLVVHGRKRAFEPPRGDIDCGNSGTGMHLLAGLLVDNLRVPPDVK